MEVLKSQKIANKFICEKCDYKCCNKFDFNKHLVTSKHQKGSILEETCDKLSQNSTAFICICGKTCKTHGGMWKHKKKCDISQKEQYTADDNMIISLVMEVMKNNSELQKQNDEFKSLMVEQNNKMIETFQEVCKNGINNNSVNQINSNNKTFNLNVFLNEQCKDAMNIMEFVDSIKLDLSDAEMVGKLGYINGISHIIIKHLKALDVHMRPVHCTDLKRETLYVKYEDVWEKEGDDNKLIRKAIKHISSKNHNAAETFKEIHPDCMEYNSKHGDHFLNLRIEALGGSGNDSYEGHSKIIKKIAKEVIIDKNS